ncbi:2-succinyl-5-enolpyruvyl-6-hydroxy-3-cyclohexene-1-carboxylic-acid synthase [Corynebacterium caspium]|uniref:2-succinyl-5-enolpyruvyl-6-hydroxy-3- cyclohexene-1-carboxylic-acid synthase n=1 Tax=Corynebacterium caspium TaxID=234828 RepID=UPI00035DBBC5|nr:2-succinyl-5-enolpyruvyl-6-hydroxy-3-cyclohexene-1-carboxylic-acid synthase [Corynebacterium caspium]WKD59878.1 2-succinyl-5-enolpyruvyl-6-hydroxy-3-cyclohexene-1-carboxylate synthase [Corynebacterium caspium DSM 44850]
MSELSSPEIAAHVVSSLADHLTDVVLCPGSRNSALALELLAHPKLRVHVRIDERAAAFLALGMARVTGRHVGVVMTSGTAVANCLPAVVEAQMSHTPLAIISADRPARLVGTGASQTIDQDGIFGVYATTTTYSPDLDFAELFSANTVHLNIAFEDPLLPAVLPSYESGETAGSESAEPAAAATTAATTAAASAPTLAKPQVGLVDHGVVAVDLSLDTLVIAGDEAWAVPGLEDVPTIAEPTAPAPFYPVHPLTAGLFLQGEISTGENKDSEYAEYIAKVRPQQIIVVGHPTLHRAVFALMSAPDLKVITLSRTELFTDPAGVSAAKGSRVETKGKPSAQWIKLCAALSETAAEVVRSTLEKPELGFSGLHVAAGVADGLGVEDILVLGPSNPVRDASLVGLPFDGVETYSPRGAAGIDGVVSQAIGAALATQSRDADLPRAPRTVALLGDITFLHDISGLFVGENSPYPENLTIVVANDHGGGIFESLEIGAEPLRPSFEDTVATPQRVHLESLATAYGIPYRRATNLTELLEHLNETIEEPQGITILEAETTRVTRREIDQQLKAALGLDK